MRSSGSVVPSVWLLILCVCCLWPSLPASADAPQEYLDVKTDPAGGVIATARLVFPASPDLIRSLLTDYPHWPDLFEVRMRIVDLHIARGVVTTDLRIDHALLPGERRLVTESRVISGAIHTDLVAGDFKRYHRVWRLAPTNEGRETRAEFELTVAIDSILPDWLVALAMRRELEAHFRIVKEKARALAASPEK
jgi:ribosome-associated toxin RatA of RatAB toxin-antitoxin module